MLFVHHHVPVSSELRNDTLIYPWSTPDLFIGLCFGQPQTCNIATWQCTVQAGRCDVNIKKGFHFRKCTYHGHTPYVHVQLEILNFHNLWRVGRRHRRNMLVDHSQLLRICTADYKPGNFISVLFHISNKVGGRLGLCRVNNFSNLRRKAIKVRVSLVRPNYSKTQISDIWRPEVKTHILILSRHCSASQ